MNQTKKWNSMNGKIETITQLMPMTFISVANYCSKNSVVDDDRHGFIPFVRKPTKLLTDCSAAETQTLRSG